MKKFSFNYFKIMNPLSFHTRFPKIDQHTGDKWIIHDTKKGKGNQLQSTEHLL